MREDISMKLIFEEINEETGDKVEMDEITLGDSRMNGINSINYQIKFEGAY